ncbi:MAG: hypothetical protein AAF806_20090 [Bacteroidota bacterium]
MKKFIFLIYYLTFTIIGLAQKESPTPPAKERLDFAKMYFEVGSIFLPSFQGKYLSDDNIESFKNPASAIQYLNWGGFHFWGHGEFYVSFPLAYSPLRVNEERASEILHSVVSGFRYYPWVYQERKIIPYIGGNWSASQFKQAFTPEIDQPVLFKDFGFSLDAGALFGYKSFALRVGASYFTASKWAYPISRTQKAEIKTPPLAFNVGLLYGFDSTKDTQKENIDAWNKYPTLSKLSFDARRFGDFFLGIGPSTSFSLKKSSYNQQKLPYLPEKLASGNYFDIAVGYHFNKANLFTTISFRNPSFETDGYNTQQSIKKTSFTFEINKFLLDYSGFAPFIGINIAHDKLTYQETVDEVSKTLLFNNQLHPGLTFGWDIVHGKTQEALILRTNLRWYPFLSFEVEDHNFDFSQLEYNLIQVIFYPQRLKSKR